MIKPLFGIKAELPDSFKGILDYSGLIKEFPDGKTVIVMELERIIPLDYEEIHKLTNQYWDLTDEAGKSEFKRIQTALNEIAPKGCYFGRRNGAWGFWEYKDRS